jgi:uncharacterized membrane protein YvlD (DUF360 family)
VSIFTVELKNTRFFLTLLVMFGLFLAVIADFLIIILAVPINDIAFGLLNLIVGAMISQAGTCYTSYFEKRAEIDTIKFGAGELIKPP